MPFIANNSVDEIYSSHALEYFDFNQVEEVLFEWKRCLKLGGLLRLSVPDFDKLIKVYQYEKLDIEKIIGPLFGRWKINDKDYIYHRTVFTKNKLMNTLKSCGFNNIELWDPLTYFGSGEDCFDDYSKAYYPHMDFTNGFSISVNLVAKK